MNQIQAVIFDMDGLMFDTEKLFFIVHTSIAEKRGKIFSLEIQNKMMGRKPIDAINVMIEELGIDEIPEVIVKERDEAYLKLLKTDAEAMPGLFEFLEVLKKHHIRKAIASGSSHEWINILLERFNIHDQFEVIVSGQDVKIAKPDPEIYHKAVAQLGLRPENCVVLEDSLNGIKAAKAADCIAVAIPSHFTQYQDFSEAHYIVESLADSKLKDIVGI